MFRCGILTLSMTAGLIGRLCAAYVAVVIQSKLIGRFSGYMQVGHLLTASVLCTVLSRY